MGARLTAGACLSSFIAALPDEHFALHAVWVTEEDAPYFAEVGDDAVACTSVHEPATNVGECVWRRRPHPSIPHPYYGAYSSVFW